MYTQQLWARKHQISGAQDEGTLFAEFLSLVGHTVPGPYKAQMLGTGKKARRKEGEAVGRGGTVDLGLGGLDSHVS